LQKDVDFLREWAVENGLTINPGKSKVTKKLWKRAVVNTWE